LKLLIRRKRGVCRKKIFESLTHNSLSERGVSQSMVETIFEIVNLTLMRGERDHPFSKIFKEAILTSLSVIGQSILPFNLCKILW
jgi:hypothetical protein